MFNLRDIKFATINENGNLIGKPVEIRGVSVDELFEFDRNPSIINVIFNNPATIVFWSDNTKTVVKCQEGDEWDAEKGLAMAVAKKYFGNKGNYNNEFNKWLCDDGLTAEGLKDIFDRMAELMRKGFLNE